MKKASQKAVTAQQLAARVAAAKYHGALKAQSDLDAFRAQADWGGLIVTPAGREANLRMLRRALDTAYPASKDSQARELVGIADQLEASSGLVGGKIAGYLQLAKQLRVEAESMKASTSSCPWGSPDILEQLTPGERVAGAALWRCNANGKTAWVIPKEQFCTECYGEPEIKIETVKSRVSKLCSKLRNLGVDLSVRVRNRHSLRQLECEFIPKNQDKSSRRKP